MKAKMTADQLAQSMASRLSESGGWISVAQCAYLLSLAHNEIRRAGFQPDPYDALGSFTRESGETIQWELHRAPNHAGLLKLTRQTSTADMDEDVICAYDKLIQERDAIRNLIATEDTQSWPDEIRNIFTARLTVLTAQIAQYEHPAR